MNYTKGKWYVSPSGKILVKEGEQYIYICQMPFSSAREADEMPEANANAQLIAAAPEMYEVLKEARELLKDEGYVNDSYMISRIDKVLAKAEGK